MLVAIKLSSGRSIADDHARAATRGEPVLEPGRVLVLVGGDRELLVRLADVGGIDLHVSALTNSANESDI
jgi:hypothetical protein